MNDDRGSEELPKYVGCIWSSDCQLCPLLERAFSLEYQVEFHK